MLTELVHCTLSQMGISDANYNPRTCYNRKVLSASNYIKKIVQELTKAITTSGPRAIN